VAGFLRMQLGKVMKLRSVPQLHFHYDESVRRGVHLSSLIERAVAEDRSHKSEDEE
ncbi:ribosome-binding factor A, partial [Halopseudomonas pelagia]